MKILQFDKLSSAIQRTNPILICSFIVALASCTGFGDPEPESNANNGLIDYKIAEKGVASIEIIDSTGKTTLINIPIAGGKLITDSATITGGVLLLDVHKLDSSKATADQLPYIGELKKAGNPKNGLKLPIKINSVVPAPVNKLTTDSGKLAQSTHLFNTTFELSDTSTVLQYGCSMTMQPMSISWVADGVAPPVSFGIYDLQYRGRVKFRWNVTATKSR